MVIGDCDEDGPAVGHGVQASPDEFGGQRSHALLDFDGQDSGSLRERVERRRPQEPPGIDGDEKVADPLDLAQQVTGNDDGDAEFLTGPLDQGEHLIAAGRVQAVCRLVEQQQPRIVDQRLGELDPLLHAGRVTAHRPVALLV